MCTKKLLKTKNDYRSYAKKIRQQLVIAEISRVICAKIVDLEEYKAAKTVAGFYPFGSEIDLRCLYTDSSKKFLLPRVIDEENIEFYLFNEETQLEKNKWGILEPKPEQETAKIVPDIILIPALMVDKQGYRLGYGKGYYDRYLSKLPEHCLKILPVAEELFVDSLPHDEHDVRVDIALTQSNIYDFRLIPST
ncbi:MAG: 5-formyltetrahydrofolate cyclo-ligase [Candidatus Gastranaerophilales bacterium]|nr:5-formyltetrahydrofolate cyclo-ligase [Candidatus Gastranaerophilales bacterium]